MDALKNASIIILLLVLLIVLPVTVYLGKSYFTLSAQVEKNQNNEKALQQLTIDSNTSLTQKLNTIDQTYLNNRYILSNQTPLNKVDMKVLCEQNNPIECLYDKQGKLAYLDTHENFKYN